MPHACHPEQSDKRVDDNSRDDSYAPHQNDKAVTDQDPDSAPIPSVTTTSTGSTAAGPDVLARILGGVGLVLDVVALLIAVVKRRPRQRAS